MADVTLPQLGETVTEGTITQWFKQVGDTVAADEPLFEVSTDKVDTEVPSPIAGVLVEIRVAEGATIEVGSVVAVVGDAGAPAVAEPEPVVSAPAVAAPVVAAPAVAEPEPVVATPVVAEPVVATSAPVSSADQRLLSPVVRRLVNEHGIDPATIDGTGPGGRITREDVLDHLDARPAPSAPVVASPTAPAPAAPAPAPAVAAPAAPVSAAPAPPVPTPAARPVVATGERATRVPLSKIRRLTGDHMIASKATSPHAFSVVEVDFANVDNARSAARAEFQASEGFGLTYLPFVVRAIVDGLAEFPHLNASLDGDDLVVHGFVDLGIAVDLDHEGLLAPVVRSAETKRLRAIAREIRDLADRARARRLSPDEISGGTFTISNNGSAGSVLTMPIINQPQVAIVSTDAIVRRPVVARTTDGSEAIVVHPVGNLAMSWDHRAFDGAYAAGFLSRVKEILETRNWNGEL
ncbi:MAG: dihydrolipoamide acetyltransferase family protein [Ilumatobacteraceae bacterium]